MAPTDDELMAQALRAIAARNAQGSGGVAAVAADPNNNGVPPVVAPQEGLAGALPPSAIRDAPQAQAAQPAAAEQPQQPAAAQQAAADQPIPGDTTALQAQLAQAIAERDRHRKHAQIAMTMTLIAAGCFILLVLYINTPDPPSLESTL